MKTQLILKDATSSPAAGKTRKLEILDATLQHQTSKHISSVSENTTDKSEPKVCGDGRTSDTPGSPCELDVTCLYKARGGV